MSLRLRILLLIAAANATVLVLAVGASLVAGPADPVAAGALAEAFRVAEDRAFSPAACRYARFVVRVFATGEEAEVPAGPPELRKEAAAIAARLAADIAAGARGVRYDAEGMTLYFAAPTTGSRAVYVAFNDRARREAFANLRSVFLYLFAGTVLLVLATYLILSRVVLRPIEALARAAGTVARGQPPVPVPRTGHGDEMDRLVESFNHMAGEVHEYQTRLEDRVLGALARAKAAEGHLVVAQRLAATGTLAAGIAHEINNPLGGIANAVLRLREGDLSPAKSEEYFRIVLDGLDRIAKIVQRVLDFTPRQTDPMPVDCADVCRRAADLAMHRAEPRGIRLEVRAEASVGGVVGDPQELIQAVLNLVLNGIDAIPEGAAGTITLSTRAEGGFAVLEVADDGSGMDEETRRRCVDMFYTTKAAGKGYGLGLAAVQHIATDHGGDLEIESELGRGTRVRLRIPLGQP
ncbi:MAG: sensor histidine kinase [Planctomycetaceae bacterium]